MSLTKVTFSMIQGAWVNPDDYGAVGNGTTDDSAAFQLAANAGTNIRLSPNKTYKLLTGFTKTGKIVFDGSGSTILSDVAWMTVTDGSGSVVADLVMNNITTPYTIQRNYVTWANQTAGDVTQKNTGYMPTGNDTDFWSSLSPSIQNQNISPRILFLSSSSTANVGVTISNITARFGCIELQGYQQSIVTGCNIQGGWGDAILFLNGVDKTFPNKTALGFTLARGYGNQAIGNRINTPSWCGVGLFGNDYAVVTGNYVQGAGESGIKTAQKENPTFPNPWPVGAVCYFCVIDGNTVVESRFDGVDANSVYDDATPVKEPSYVLVSNNTCKNNRSTGITCNAELAAIVGNYVAENGVFGLRSIGSNSKVTGNYLANNVTHPGALGPFNSYDLAVSGTEKTVSDNTVFRGSPPVYTYAVYVNETGHYLNNVSNEQPFVASTMYSLYVDVAGRVIHNSLGQLSDGGVAGASNFQTNDSEFSGFFYNTNVTPYGVMSKFSADPNNTSSWFYRAVGNTSERFSVRSNGGIANYSGNDVNLSDRREKTDFAPAKSYLDVICSIPVQTFRYIDQTDNEKTLGVVAQDVQAAAPELVMESNWGTSSAPKMRLSIYQTDLQYALMKALQELKTEFDAYKANHP